MSTGDPVIDAMMPAVEGVFGAIGQGMANMLFGNPQEEARKRAERELAAQRAAEAARRRAEEEARRKEQEHNALMSTLMPVPGSVPADEPGALPTETPVPGSSDTIATTARRKGLEDARQCYPSNAFGYCMAGKPEEYQSCVDEYRAGFAEGEVEREREMDDAYATGYEAGKKESDDGKLDDDPFNHPNAQGPCRVEWIKAYNSGHFQGKAEGTAR